MTASTVSLNKGADIFIEGNLIIKDSLSVWVPIMMSSTLLTVVQSFFKAQPWQSADTTDFGGVASVQVLTSMQLCTVVLAQTSLVLLPRMLPTQFRFNSATPTTVNRQSCIRHCRFQRQRFWYLPVPYGRRYNDCNLEGSGSARYQRSRHLLQHIC